jgi:magnesium-transporting ATPase (P-type)
MENTEEIRKIEVDQKTLKNINSIRKWTMFLSVIGFIFLGLIIVLGLLAGTFLTIFNTAKTGTGFPESIILILLLLLAIVYFFPGIFLFRFSKHAAIAVHNIDEQELYKAFRNLKFYFTIVGVLIILGLLIYVAVLVSAGTTIPFLKGL